MYILFYGKPDIVMSINDVTVDSILEDKPVKLTYKIEIFGLLLSHEYDITINDCCNRWYFYHSSGPFHGSDG